MNRPTIKLSEVMQSQDFARSISERFQLVQRRDNLRADRRIVLAISYPSQ